MTAKDSIQYALDMARKAKAKAIAVAVMDAANNVTANGGAGGDGNGEADMATADLGKMMGDLAAHRKTCKAKSRETCPYEKKMYDALKARGVDADKFFSDAQAQATQGEVNVDTANKDKGGAANGGENANANANANANGNADGGEDQSATFNEADLATEEEVMREDVRDKNFGMANANGGQADGANANANANANVTGNADGNANANGGDNGDGGNAKVGKDEPPNIQQTPTGHLSALPDPRFRERHMSQLKDIISRNDPTVQAALVSKGVTEESLVQAYDQLAADIKAWEATDEHDIINGVRGKIQAVHSVLDEGQRDCGTFDLELKDGKAQDKSYPDGFGITFHCAQNNEEGHSTYLDDAEYDRRTSMFRDLTQCSPNVGMWQNNPEISFVCKDPNRTIAMLVMFEQETTFSWENFECIANNTVNRYMNNPKH